MDADFCAQFIQIMHSQGTPGFHTLGCYDKVRVVLRSAALLFTCLQLLGDHVKVVLFSCSEYEARNYGVYLQICPWISNSVGNIRSLCFQRFEEYLELVPGRGGIHSGQSDQSGWWKDDLPPWHAKKFLEGFEQAGGVL
jgi:hypothetical protein